MTPAPPINPPPHWPVAMALRVRRVACRGPRGAPWLAANLIWQGPPCAAAEALSLVHVPVPFAGVSTAPDDARDACMPRSAPIEDALGVAPRTPIVQSSTVRKGRGEERTSPPRDCPCRGVGGHVMGILRLASGRGGIGFQNALASRCSSHWPAKVVGESAAGAGKDGVQSPRRDEKGLSIAGFNCRS